MMPHLQHIPPPTPAQTKLMLFPRNELEEQAATSIVYARAAQIREARRWYFHDHNFLFAIEKCSGVKTKRQIGSRIEQRKTGITTRERKSRQ